MSTKHTPGPWKAYGMATRTIWGNKAICTVHGARKGEDPLRDANARLIAAAPELLEALRGLLDHMAVPSSVCRERPAYEAARAAIAKAEGGAA